jgi:hypothetical protein
MVLTEEEIELFFAVAWGYMVWGCELDSAGIEQGLMVVSHEYDNEHSVYMIGN